MISMQQTHTHIFNGFSYPHKDIHFLTSSRDSAFVEVNFLLDKSNSGHYIRTLLSPHFKPALQYAGRISIPNPGNVFHASDSESTTWPAG
jgi:hypothetical protein